MIKHLAKIFIEDYENVKDPKVRSGYGVICGAVGIFFNIVLFAIKLFAGMVSGSVAIMADAINNLSDAGSSIITMVGFKMSNRKPDPDHPFGHGRIEYVTGLVVSLLIIVMGVELIKSSFNKIIHPEAIEANTVTIVILAVSILVKLYMFLYNKKTGDNLSSAAMKATAMDSFTDAISTAVVLISMAIMIFFDIPVDGYCGMLVSLFILYTGLSSAKDTLDPLLGSKPTKEYVDSIERFVTSYDDILGIHDLVVHDYGPGRVMISLHAEVPSNGDILELHDTIDNIEQKMRDVLGCEAVIHMDPVVVDDEKTSRMKRLTNLIVKSVDESFTMHDFRMVVGPTHTNLIFDVVVPYDVPLSKEEIRNIICGKVSELPGNHFAVVKIDIPYV